jgi:DNA-binding transcriptional MerR regulator
MYYRIGEAAQLVGVQPHVLRYWQSEFRSIRPIKSSSGQRVYSRRDIETLLRVKTLLKDQGYTIEGARKRLREGGVEPAVIVEPAAQTDGKMREALGELRREVVAFLEKLEQA